MVTKSTTATAAATTTTKEKLSLGRVLVIGGCGFLGHHVVRLLLRDWNCTAVSVVDLRCTRNRRPDSDGVEYVEADITDADNLVKILGRLRPDVVIHTASPPAQGSGAVVNAVFKKVNVDGTRAVVAACQQADVKALVYTSSASVMSDNRSDLINASEEWPVIRGSAQSEYYSETKAEAEELVLAANRTEPYSLLTAAIRPSGIFGEGDMQLVHHAVQIYRDGKDGVQVGENTNLFDFTYAENAAHGHLLAALALLATHAKAKAGGPGGGGGASAPLDYERVDGEAFLITNDEPVYFWDMMRAIWHAAGSRRGPRDHWVLGRELGITLGFASEVFFGLIRKPPSFNRQRIIYSCMTRYYDISKAKRRLGYRPLVGLTEGVRRSVQWTLEQEKK